MVTPTPAELGQAAQCKALAEPRLEAHLQPVAAQQKAINADLAAFDTATLDTFKAVKTKFEHDLALLNNTMRAAKSKLPP